MNLLAEVLRAIGPNASIVFAAWIFMGFLQQRYDAAIDRFRGAVGDFRSEDHSDARGEGLKDQILAYLRRCRLMAWANLIGLVSAVLLIASLIFGALDVLAPGKPLLIWSGIAMSIAGFALVILAALIVIFESRIVYRQLTDELQDIPDFSKVAGAEGLKRDKAAV